MPERGLGQMITFAIQKDDDQEIKGWIWVQVKKGDTIAKIAADRGNPDMARKIAEVNGVRSVNSKFTGKKGGKTRIKVPPQLRDALSVDVLAGDTAPHITGGYAKFQTVERPERVGLTAFEGFDPVTMEIPIRFEAPRGTHMGLRNDLDIVALERMAGRGNFPGVGVGPPPIIKINTTNDEGKVVPLIPRNYQRTDDNPDAPLWRITNIEWDPDPVRNVQGNRTRQLATVTVQQATHISLLSRSATERAKTKSKHKAKPKKSTAKFQGGKTSVGSKLR